MFGAFNAFNQYLRFAAAEAADDEFRPKAISWVIGGGILAAFVGGTLAGNTANLMLPQYVAAHHSLRHAHSIRDNDQFVEMPERKNRRLLRTKKRNRPAGRSAKS